jgi:hypothetical protein
MITVPVLHADARPEEEPMLRHASMLRVLVLAAALSTAGMIACEMSTPGISSAAPAETLCLDAAAPGDTADGSAAPAPAPGAATGVPTIGPDPVCATGQ